jgi:hypothetical protein
MPHDPEDVGAGSCCFRVASDGWAADATHVTISDRGQQITDGWKDARPPLEVCGDLRKAATSP